MNKASLMQEVVGSVQGRRDGHGFIVPDDGMQDIFLPAEEMRQLVHLDRVRVRIVRQDRKGRPEGTVLEILSRPSHQIIGHLLQENGVWLVAPEDRRYGQDILISQAPKETAKAGDLVVVELEGEPSVHTQPMGRVVEVLGKDDDPGMEIEIAVRKYGVPHEFSEACQRAAKRLPGSVREADCKNRVDLRDIPFVTIDGEDARDFDDAVYCEPARVGRGKGWRLLVAIADVSHYVKSGGAIDVDAFERATSIYFPRRVIPMLPEKLSNGLCSLNPGVDRLCLVCDMMINVSGETHAYQFYPAVMHSHARMTYTQVSEILKNTRGSVAQQHEALLPEFLNLNAVFKALLAAREVRGAVDFETVETQIICDDNGRILRIVPRERTQAHRLIEEAMLAANECSADFLLQSGHLSLFRVHEGPTPERENTLRSYLEALGLGLSIPSNPTSQDFQKIAQATQHRPDAQQIHSMLLRSMQQAVYTPHNNGHFGLAFEAYTHFTSPIRRYPDLLVHRVIKAVLGHSSYKLPKIPAVDARSDAFRKKLSVKVQQSQSTESKSNSANKANNKESSKENQAKLLAVQDWELAGLHCSANERRADEASRDVQAWLKCQYMKEHLGEVFDAVVSAVVNFGLFVTLKDLYVEGLVHVTDLGGEYFRYDEGRQELIGERTGIRYAIGTPLKVQVSRVDLELRKIDLTLVREASDSQDAVTRNASTRRALRRGAGHDEQNHSEQRFDGEKSKGRASTSKSRKKSENRAEQGRNVLHAHASVASKSKSKKSSSVNRTAKSSGKR